MILATNGSTVVVAIADKLVVGTADSHLPRYPQATYRFQVIDHERLDEVHLPLGQDEVSLQTNGQLALPPNGKKLVAHNSGIKSYKPDVENTRWISAVAVSASGILIAAVDNLKDLFVYSIRTDNESLDQPNLILRRNVAKRCMAVTFTSDEQSVIIADKLGDAYIFPVTADATKDHSPILGHISVLTDVVMSPDDKYILTSDRDEKIRVSHFPLADDIQTFCLGHTEFVCRILIPSPDYPVVLSGSGDCTIKAFNYRTGNELTSVSLLGESLSDPTSDAGVYVNSLNYNSAIHTVFTSLRSKKFIFGFQLQMESNPNLRVALLPSHKITMPGPVISVGLVGTTLLMLLEDTNNTFDTVLHIDKPTETGARQRDTRFSSYEETLKTVVQDVEKSGRYTNLFRDPFVDMFNMFSRGSEVESELVESDAKKGSRKDAAREVSPAYRPNTKRAKTDPPDAMDCL